MNLQRNNRFNTREVFHKAILQVKPGLFHKVGLLPWKLQNLQASQALVRLVFRFSFALGLSSVRSVRSFSLRIPFYGYTVKMSRFTVHVKFIDMNCTYTLNVGSDVF